MNNFNDFENFNNFNDFNDLLTKIFALCKQKKVRLTTAESCTGGMISQVLTALSGASEILDCAFVVYNEAAKINLINVPEKIISDFGVVSTQCAEKMAIGAVKKSPSANLGISSTGIAGPNGGNEKNPLGCVCFALYFENNGKIISFRKIFDGNRQQVRIKATFFILSELEKFLKNI